MMMAGAETFNGLGRIMILSDECKAYVAHLDMAYIKHTFIITLPAKVYAILISSIRILMLTANSSLIWSCNI
jgi:hypothetical protein